MSSAPLSRRQLLRHGALALPLLLAGCGSKRSRLLASRGDFPALWAARLPQDWASQTLEDPAAVLAAMSAAGKQPASGQPAGLVQLWDGWASAEATSRWQPFGAAELLKRLAPEAAAPARLFRPAGSPALAFPFALDPWVLLLKQRPDLVRRADEGWNLLLDPSLNGRLVLPSSPRLTMALLQGDALRLRQLRQAALASDERNGLSLLLNGDAEALVLPRRRALPLLRSDPRLQVVLPAQGAPLGWNLLLRPAGSRADLPLTWLAAALQPPLLPRLLAAGWLPPLPRPQLEQAAATLPTAQRALLLPPPSVLERCWNLPPLQSGERQALQELWDGAAPAGAAAAGT